MEFRILSQSSDICISVSSDQCISPKGFSMSYVLMPLFFVAHPSNEHYSISLQYDPLHLALYFSGGQCGRLWLVHSCTGHWTCREDTRSTADDFGIALPQIQQPHVHCSMQIIFGIVVKVTQSEVNIFRDSSKHLFKVTEPCKKEQPKKQTRKITGTYTNIGTTHICLQKPLIKQAYHISPAQNKQQLFSRHLKVVLRDANGDT